MKTILLKGELRKEIGTKDAKNIRNEGKVPCVLYGGGENVHFFVYAADFKNLVYTPNTYKVRLDIDGKNYEAYLKDMQFHSVSEVILHADFQLIFADKPIIIDIPVKITGNSPGVRAGGKLIQKIQRIKVKGVVNNIPEYAEVNISNLEMGQSFKVKNLESSGFEILDAKENAIVSVKMTRASIAAAEAGK